MRCSTMADSGRSRTTAHVGFGTSGSATARITSRVCGCGSPAGRQHVVGHQAGEAVAAHPLRQHDRRRQMLPRARPWPAASPAACVARAPPAPARPGTAARRPARSRSRRTDSASRCPPGAARASRCTAPAVVLALHLEPQWSGPGTAPGRSASGSATCTRYELTLKNSSSPASRKNVMTSSTGTTPTNTYDRMSLRRTRHSSRRLAQNAKRVSP